MLDSGPIGLGATGEIAISYVEDFQLRAILFMSGIGMWMTAKPSAKKENLKRY